jgi:hypothetical protein
MSLQWSEQCARVLCRKASACLSRAGVGALLVVAHVGIVGMTGCSEASLPTSSGEAGIREQVARVESGAVAHVIATLPLTNDDWESLRGLHGLRELVLQAGRADDARANILASLPNIERLVLRESPLTDAGFRILAACTTLRDLNVPQAACTAAGVEILTGLPQLRSLRLGGTALDGKKVCEAIVRLPHLRTCHLIDVPIGDEGLMLLASRPDLWNLYLDGSRASDEAWERYFEACPTVHVHVDQAHHDRDPDRNHK